LRAGLWREALDDLTGVVAAAAGRPVKVILETHLLSREQKVEGCVLAELAGAAFVKTTTGFTGGGATVEDVQLMRRAVGDRLAVKASGGIRSLEAAQALIFAGAARLGSSASVALIKGARASGGY
jgi:deoxyribose-phosphate aldolase